MVKYNLVLALCFVFQMAFAAGPTKYRVFFTDKGQQTFSADSFFHPNALARRARCGVAVNPTDYPVYKPYIQATQPLVDEILMQSRWLNMLVVYTDEQRAALISQLPHVDHIAKAPQLQAEVMAKADQTAQEDQKEKNERYAAFQLARMQGERFTNQNIKGQKVRIAVFDAGFTNTNKHAGLAHLQIEATYDFVKDASFVYDYSWHGTGVLGCIGGYFNQEQLTGLAPEATYLLARTERHPGEYLSEEENWLEAAEWADKLGADLINSSLGYTEPRYFVEQMDGEYTLVSRAAQMAFRKGIVVVTSAGNEGSGRWKYIGAPGDADSVLTIGGINPFTDYRTNFSSFGPSSDGRLKPNVTAIGIALTASENGYGRLSGTSFSSPLVAGFVACYMQAFPHQNQHEVFEAIQQCGHLYPYFDYLHGYGVPQAWKAMGEDNPVETARWSLNWENDSLFLVIDEAYHQKHLAQDSQYLDKMNNYLHVEGHNGILAYYAVLRLKSRRTALLSTNDYEQGQMVRVHFEGITQEARIE